MGVRRRRRVRGVMAAMGAASAAVAPKLRERIASLQRVLSVKTDAGGAKPATENAGFAA